MKFAIVTQGCLASQGGIELVVDTMARGLVSRNHAVTVLVPETLLTGSVFARRRPYPPIDAPYRVELLKTILPEESACPPGISPADWERGPVCPDLFAALSRFDPDAILAASFPFLHVSQAVSWAREADVPAVLMGAPHFHRPWISWPSVAAAAAQADVYLALSQVEAEEVRRRWRGDGSDTRVVHFSPKHISWARREGRTARAVSNLLCFGRLSRNKGLDYLLEELSGPSARPDRRFRLVLAGARQADWEAELRARAERARGSGLEIQIETDVSPSRKEELFREADAMILPSTNESLGIVGLEAMAAGLPVLIADTPINREVYGEAYCSAAAFKSGVPGSLRSRLAENAGDASSLAERQEACRRSLGETFSHDRFIDAVESALERAVKKPARSAPGAREGRMPIAVLLHTLERNGANLFVVDLLNSLKHEFDFRVSSPKEGPLGGLFRRNGIPVEVFGIDEPRYMERLSESLKRCALVIVNDLRRPDGILASRLARRPHFWVMHERVDPQAVEESISRFWKGGWNADTVLEAVREAHCIVYPVNDLVSDFAPIEPKGESRVIYHGIDIASFDRFRSGTERREARSRLGYGESSFVFLQVGSVNSRKAQLDSLLAFARVSKAHPGKDLRLLFVGARRIYKHEVDYLGRIDRTIAGHELERQVTLLPVQEDVRSYYHAADALLCPSLCEVSPYVLKEGMAFELPIVAADIPGIRELVQDGVNGRLTPPGRPDLLAGQMDALLADPAAARAMGRRARTTVAERHSLERMIGEYRQLIRTLAKRDGLADPPKSLNAAS